MTIQVLTEPLARKFRSHGITTHAIPHETIRKKLRTPKDKDPIADTSGVVYHLNCAGCENSYIGETERKSSKRLADHKRANNPSPVQQHLHASGHSIDEVKVLARDCRWFQRGVKEAIFIRKMHPTLNQDEGRHRLAHVYNPLLSMSCANTQLFHGDVTTTISKATNMDLLPSNSEQVCKRSDESFGNRFFILCVNKFKFYFFY